MCISELLRKIRKFAGLDAADKVLFLRAVIGLAGARIRLLATPLDQLTIKLSNDAPEESEHVDMEMLRRVSFAVDAAAAHVPWRSDCFPRAIAANRLLRRYGISSRIRLGVDKGCSDQLIGHAWLTSGETVVTGGQELDRYVEIHRLGE